MKRAGFTMIELIFVIVILGILASVAVPKLLGVKSSAEEGLVKSFVGSLNQTVGPAKWSQSLMDGVDGVLKGSATTYDIKRVTDTDFPSDIPKTVTILDVSSCVTPAAAAVPGLVATGTKFKYYCIDGTSSTAPKFYYAATGTTVTAAMKTTADTNNQLKLK